ncbi:MAG TPA: hypothetical protein VLI04_02085 [Nocardioidaceae bacterium]|nr:hypothetical protein [Nocardioidaceae bacterium]
MARKVQIVCASMGFAFVVVLFGGIIVADMLPPFSPSAGAEEVAAWYQENTNGIRFGMVLMMFGALMTAPWGALLAAHIKKVEGEFTPLTYTFLAATAAGCVAIFMPVMIFSAAAFRPERSAEITQTLNDMAWIPFIMNGPPAITQAIVLGAAILMDKRARPAFPRWAGYYNFWVGFGFLPACILLYFKSGPFAWDGVLSFWLAATVFGTWFITMSILMLRALPDREERTLTDDDELILAAQ